MRRSVVPVKMSRLANSLTADEADGQAQAADVLVGAERDGQQAHQGAGDEAHHDGADQAEPGVAGVEGHREAEEGARVHGALDAQVEDAGALGVGLAHRAVDERRGVAEGGGQDVGEEGHVGELSDGGACRLVGWRLALIGRPFLLAAGCASGRGQGADDDEQQRALHHGAQLARDLQAAHGRGGAHREVAQQQARQQHAGHGQSAQHGHHDAGVAEAGRDAGGEPELDAGHLADAGHAGDGAADEGHAQERALDLDAGEAGTVRGEAHGAHAQAGGGAAQHVPGDHDEDDGDDEAEVQA